MGDMHAPVLGSVVLSSATAWMMLHLVLGDEPLFHVSGYQLLHPVEFLVYALLGAAGGLVSVCFVKLLLRMRARFLRLPKWTQWCQPVAGGLLVGILGWFVPEVLGVGYGYVGDALNGQMALKLMALLVALKVVATATCYASGNAGGIFGPSLFIGAMLGGTVGQVAHSLFPNYTASAGAYALVGMGATFAGIVRTPLTSVIMIFEVTRDYAIIVPLMISNLISFFISYRLQPEPIYEALTHQDGIHLPSGETRDRQGRVQVARAMRSGAEGVSSRLTAAAAVEHIRRSGFETWPVTDGRQLLGMIALSQLEREIESGNSQRTLDEILKAPEEGHLDARTFPHLHADHSLDLALQRMGDSRLDALPVVSRANVRQLMGIVTLDDILKAYGVAVPKQSSQRE